MLIGLTTLPKKRPLFELPLLDFSNAEIFGNYVAIIRSLEKDLSFLEAASLPLDKWSEYLCQLLHRYFAVEEKEYAIFQWIEEKCALLTSDLLPKTPYRFPPIFDYLCRVFEEMTGKQEPTQIDSLLFSSFKPGAIDDASVICLLGLDENSFPQQEPNTSLRELQLKEKPLAQQEGRHFFLEALFAAKERLILSYVGINEEDGKEQAPSLIIQELQYFLGKISIEKSHPPFIFHKNYFKTPQPVSNTAFLAAKKYYFSKATPSPFIPEFFIKTPLSTSSTDSFTVTLRDLQRFAKHPLRFYLNQKLHLYLNYEEKDEEFALSPLNQSLLLTHSYTSSFEEAFKEAKLCGKLPIGRFQEIAKNITAEECQNFSNQLKKLKVKSPPFSFDLCFHLPLGSHQLSKVEGTLFDASSEGLLFYGEKNTSDLLKIWPLYLAYACQTDCKELLLIKSGERLRASNPKQALTDYLIYYEIAQTTPSLLLPKWGHLLLENKSEELKKNRLNKQQTPMSFGFLKSINMTHLSF